MPISKHELQTIVNLAYLEANPSELEKLNLEINSIIDFVQQLQGIDTTTVLPLVHPVNLNHQPRSDVITEQDCTDQLAAIAPAFEDNLYLVPKFING